MDRVSPIRRARALFAAACSLLGLLGVAGGDRQQWLHVRHFAMSVDRAHVRAGESFHLRIDLRTDEPATNCDNVMLPDFYGMESLGDERRASPSAGGTECVEIVTLSPAASGSLTIPPATLDAIDATTSRPSRFSTNTVTINVLHAPLRTETILWNTVLQMLKALVVVILGIAVAAVGYWALRRVLPGFAPVRRLDEEEKRGGASEERSSPPIDDGERGRALLAILSAEPSRRGVLAVRVLLRDWANARQDEAFGELLARVAASTDPALLEAMRAIERAAFIDDEHLAEAIRDALRALKILAHKQQALT